MNREFERRQAWDNIAKIILSRFLLLGLALAVVAAGLSYIPIPSPSASLTPLPEGETRTLSAPCGGTSPKGGGMAEVTYNTMILSHDWSGEDEEMLLKMAMAEAEGESTTVKALVMLCILNRVWSDEFPDSIPEVLYQENQFTPILDGRYYAAEPDEDCRKAMEMIKDGWDQSQGCMWYESCDGGSDWHQENLEHVYTVGCMRFYRERTE